MKYQIRGSAGKWFLWQKKGMFSKWEALHMRPFETKELAISAMHCITGTKEEVYDYDEYGKETTDYGW